MLSIRGVGRRQLVKAANFIGDRSASRQSSERVRGFDRGSYTYTRALALYRQQQFDDASQVFETVLEEAPELAKAWISYAQVRQVVSCGWDANVLSNAPYMVIVGFYIMGEDSV